jgi:hypothetical protein
MPTIVTKDGTEIYYKDWGAGQPLFFHHGWPLSADDWDTQMMFFLEHGYRVIAHDRRGHGPVRAGANPGAGKGWPSEREGERQASRASSRGSRRNCNFRLARFWGFLAHDLGNVGDWAGDGPQNCSAAFQKPMRHVYRHAARSRDGNSLAVLGICAHRHRRNTESATTSRALGHRAAASANC